MMSAIILSICGVVILRALWGGISPPVVLRDFDHPPTRIPPHAPGEFPMRENLRDAKLKARNAKDLEHLNELETLIKKLIKEHTEKAPTDEKGNILWETEKEIANTVLDKLKKTRGYKKYDELRPKLVTS